MEADMKGSKKAPKKAKDLPVKSGGAVKGGGGGYWGG
jgi:hypothetical protein